MLVLKNSNSTYCELLLGQNRFANQESYFCWTVTIHQLYLQIEFLDSSKKQNIGHPIHTVAIGCSLESIGGSQLNYEGLNKILVSKCKQQAGIHFDKFINEFEVFMKNKRLLVMVVEER